MTGNEVARVLRGKLIRRCAEKLSLLCELSGANEYGIVLLPADRVIRKGETLGLDVGVQCRGCRPDPAGIASVGPPSEELAEYCRRRMQFRHDCNMRLRAGT